MALTWPGPRLILDTEGKASDALPDRLIDTTIKTYSDPIGADTLQMVPLPKSGETRRNTPSASAKPTAYRCFAEAVNDLYTNCPYTTVILDSWSGLSSLIVNECHSINNTWGFPLTISEYGSIKNTYENVLPALLGLPCKYLVVCGHEEQTRDEASGMTFYSVHMVGQAFRPTMPCYFSNVFRLEPQVAKDGMPRYTIRTRPSGVFTHGKTKYQELPVTCDADWRTTIGPLTKGTAANQPT